jgi:hypothetical protein
VLFGFSYAPLQVPPGMPCAPALAATRRTATAQGGAERNLGSSHAMTLAPTGRTVNARTLCRVPFQGTEDVVWCGSRGSTPGCHRLPLRGTELVFGHGQRPVGYAGGVEAGSPGSRSAPRETAERITNPGRVAAASRDLRTPTGLRAFQRAGPQVPPPNETPTPHPLLKLETEIFELTSGNPNLNLETYPPLVSFSSLREAGVVQW